MAVPAQPKAGVVKEYGGEQGPAMEEEALCLAQARQALEEKRYGT